MFIDEFMVWYGIIMFKALMFWLNEILTISSRSDIIAPNVILITGPINGDTNIAATIFEALFSTSPNAASEL